MPPILPASRSAVELGELVVEVDQLLALGDDAWRCVDAPQVDHADLLDAQGGEVRVDLGAQLVRPLRRNELAARVPVRPDLGRQHQVAGVGSERVADQRRCASP